MPMRRKNMKTKRSAVAWTDDVDDNDHAPSSSKPAKEHAADKASDHGDTILVESEAKVDDVAFAAVADVADDAIDSGGASVASKGSFLVVMTSAISESEVVVHPGAVEDPIAASDGKPDDAELEPNLNAKITDLEANLAQVDLARATEVSALKQQLNEANKTKQRLEDKCAISDKFWGISEQRALEMEHKLTADLDEAHDIQDKPAEGLKEARQMYDDLQRLTENRKVLYDQFKEQNTELMAMNARLQAKYDDLKATSEAERDRLIQEANRMVHDHDSQIQHIRQRYEAQLDGVRADLRDARRDYERAVRCFGKRDEMDLAGLTEAIDKLKQEVEENKAALANKRRLEKEVPDPSSRRNKNHSKAMESIRDRGHIGF